MSGKKYTNIINLYLKRYFQTLKYEYKLLVTLSDRCPCNWRRKVLYVEHCY